MATYYWVGGSGTWDNSSKTNWSTTSGGAGGSGPPILGDIVNFDANSGTAATVTVASTAACTSCVVNKSDINLSLSGSPTFGAGGSSGGLTFTAGTITLNNNNLTVIAFSSNNSNTRTIAFGTGKIILSGNAATIFNMATATGFSYSGTPAFESNYSGSTGTRTFTGTSTGATESIVPSLDISNGSDTVAISNSWKNLSFSGFSGSLTANTKVIYGNFTVSSGMTLSSGTGTTTFAGTTGPYTITSAGKTIDNPVTFNGVGGAWELADSLVVGTTRTVTLTNGTFNAKNQAVTLGAFALGSGTKTLTMGSGTWTVTGATWNANTNSTGLTVNRNTATITMTSSSAKTFSGGGFTWPTLNQGGSGALTIAQSNTFANITDTVQPATITLTAGTTQTVEAFSVAGTAGNLITLNSSSAGVQATLSDASGTVSLSYVSIQDIAATGGAGWNAYTSNGNIDAGNNSGWVFDPAPSDVSVEFFMNLRSFTEPRRF